MSTTFAQKTILVVEDEFLVAVDIAESLRTLGYNVTTLRTSEEVSAAERYDAVLLDYGLSGDASRNLADFLLKQGIPFAFCTGLPASELRERYPQVPTIEKPFGPAALAAVAAKFFSHA